MFTNGRLPIAISAQHSNLTASRLYGELCTVHCELNPITKCTAWSGFCGGQDSVFQGVVTVGGNLADGVL